jgi:AcrR family transcriptional regulator
MSTRRAERQEWQRRYIQERAMSVFAASGYHGTTMEQVAEAAEVSKGTLYNYFRSKEELFASLIEQGVEGLFQMVDEVVAGGGSVQEITRRLVLHFFEFFESGLGMHRILLAETDRFGTAHQKTLRELMKSRRQAFVERVAGLIQMGQERGVIRPGDPVRAASVVINILFSEIMLDAMRGHEAHYSEGADEITDYILGALGVQADAQHTPTVEGDPS